MQTLWNKKAFADFKIPEKLNEPVIVSQCLPDNTLKTIGRIYQVFNDEECAISYISVNNEGEEITPPTIDYMEAENGFENYARQLTQKSQEKDWEEIAIEFAERISGIKEIRQNKDSKTKNIALNNY